VGAFILTIGDRRLVLPNTHHVQAARTIWDRIFAAENADDLEFQVGLTRKNIPAGRNRVPTNYLLPYIAPSMPPALAVTTTIADVGGRGEGGHWDAFENGHHKHLTGYARQDVTFSVENGSGAPKLVSSSALFTNAIPAVPPKDPCTGLRHYHKDSLFAPFHGYPWDIPDFPHGLLGAIVHAAATIGGVNHRTLTYSGTPFAGLNLSGYQVTCIYRGDGIFRSYTNLISSNTDSALYWIPANPAGADPPYWPANGTQVDTYIRPGATPLGAGTCVWNDPGNINMGYVVRFPNGNAKPVGADAKRRAGWLYLLSEHTAGRFLVYSNSTTDFVLRFPEDVGAMVPPLENGTEPLTGWYSTHRTTLEEIEYDPPTGVMGPIGAVFLSTKTANPDDALLVASAIVTEDLGIPWGESLRVQYVGYLRNHTGALPYPFAEAMAKRGYMGRTECPWSGFKLALFETPPDGLSEQTELAQLVEVVGEGYARLDVAWTVGSDADGPWADLQVPAEAWENTSEDTNWTAARTLAVVGTINGTERLCWTGAIAETVLLPGKTIGLQDNVLRIRWKP
jgi:hypothetical protein